MLGRKCIPIPCTVYLFSGAAGLLGGRGGVEGDGGGASRSSEAPRRMGCSVAVHTLLLFIYFIYFFLVHTFTALLLICALMRQNCQLHRLTGG